MPHRRALVVLLLVLPLAACALFSSKDTRAMRRTPEYHAGYQDGCDSAYGPDANKRNGADQTKDEEAFKTNKNYRSGWSAGFSACRAYTPASAVPTNAGPIPDRNPGNGGIP